MGLILKGAAYTHVGKVRTNNEDNYFLFDHYKESTEINEEKYSKNSTANCTLVSVCDGMGGASMGELASLYAVSNMHACDYNSIVTEAPNQISNINKLICDEIDKRNGTRIGSTLVSLYIDEEKAVCVNLGDSRCYLVRDGQILQLSKDHSEGQRMIDYGMMTEEEAKKSKSWHVLTQHLGIFEDEFMLEPYLSEPIDLLPGDKFLLCSDGVTDLVEDQEIGQILIQNKNAEGLAEDMVNLALEKGGKDNTTVVVVVVEGERSTPLIKKSVNSEQPVDMPVNRHSAEQEPYVAPVVNSFSGNKGMGNAIGPVGYAFALIAVVLLVLLMISKGKNRTFQEERDDYKSLSKKYETTISENEAKIKELEGNNSNEDTLKAKDQIINDLNNKVSELEQKIGELNQTIEDLKNGSATNPGDGGDGQNGDGQNGDGQNGDGQNGEANKNIGLDDKNADANGGQPGSVGNKGTRPRP